MATLFIAAALLLAGAGAIFLLLALRQPDTFHYVESVIVQATADRIFPLVADPVSFNAWNPFNEDPSIKGAYSGPPRGPGARYTFESKSAGTGHTEILEERAPELLVVRLVMTKPMACDNRVEFRLEPAGRGATRVSWHMSGRMTFLGKVLNQAIDCERMCTRQFAKGLAKLKRLAESESVAA